MTDAVPTPELVYKIVTPAALAAGVAEGVFAGMPIDVADGFCHLSTGAQLADTLSLHFRGQRELLILVVRTADLGPALRWEPSRGGQLFPHYYGLLPMAAVAWQASAAVRDDGAVAMPEGLE